MALEAATHTDARRAALEGLFDHAALFPPASMEVSDALAEDRRLRASPEAWLVRRFVCPLTRLDALGPERIPLSVVLDAAPDARLSNPRVEAVEVPPGRQADLDEVEVEVYVERPLDSLEWLDDVARLGVRAKARCGGRAVPPVPQLASFIRRCRELGLPFKATAGLHHPLRGEDEHGFLNLLAAAVFGDEEEALSERDPAAFALDDEAFSWRGRSAGAAELARVRSGLLVGIGSCSIREPVDELHALGLLP